LVLLAIDSRFKFDEQQIDEQLMINNFTRSIKFYRGRGIIDVLQIKPQSSVCSQK
jgi:hypothetical protein